MANWIRGWRDGRVAEAASGKLTWYLEKRGPDGRQLALRLPGNVTSDKAAEAEAALFERDRDRYLEEHQQRRSQRTNRLWLSPELIADWTGYLENQDRKKGGQASAGYVSDSRRYIKLWAKALGRTDLRRLTLQKLRATAKHSTAERKMIVALKSCCRYLIDQGMMKPADNPTAALNVPVSKRSETPKGYAPAFINSTYTAISTWSTEARHKPDAATAQAVRDVYVLAALHGLHFSEIERIAKGETGTQIRIVSGKPDAKIAGTCVFKHKNGDQHVISMGPQTLRAVLRLQARKSAPVKHCVREYLEQASKTLGSTTPEKDRLKLSQLRHSLVSNAKTLGELITFSGRGLSLMVIGPIIGHKDPRTTAKFYDHSDTPPFILVPEVVLKHASDPAIEELQ